MAIDVNSLWFRIPLGAYDIEAREEQCNETLGHAAV